jgi:hypothetical protein
MTQEQSATAATAAPADLRQHAPWSTPRKVLAYLILFALALASIWFIDRRVDHLANDAPFTRAAPPSP